MLFCTFSIFHFIFPLYYFFSFKISKNSSCLIIPSLIELLISISIQSNLFFVKYNYLLCFFFLNFVSCCKFIIIPKDKENDKENTEVIRPNNCSFLTLIKILVPGKNVKTTVNILLE